MTDSNDNNNILSQAREYIHESVKTDARAEAEKTPIDKVKESFPNDTAEVVEMITDGVSGFIDKTKNDFESRLNEGTDREIQKQAEDGTPGFLGTAKDTVKGKVDDLRENIYDFTKSKAEKEHDKNIKEMKNTDTLSNPASMLG